MREFNKWKNGDAFEFLIDMALAVRETIQLSMLQKAVQIGFLEW